MSIYHYPEACSIVLVHAPQVVVLHGVQGQLQSIRPARLPRLQAPVHCAQKPSVTHHTFRHTPRPGAPSTLGARQLLYTMTAIETKQKHAFLAPPKKIKTQTKQVKIRLFIVRAKIMCRNLSLVCTLCHIKL